MPRYWEVSQHTAELLPLYTHLLIFNQDTTHFYDRAQRFFPLGEIESSKMMSREGSMARHSNALESIKQDVVPQITYRVGAPLAWSSDNAFQTPESQDANNNAQAGYSSSASFCSLYPHQTQASDWISKMSTMNINLPTHATPWQMVPSSQAFVVPEAVIYQARTPIRHELAERTSQSELLGPVLASNCLTHLAATLDCAGQRQSVLGTKVQKRSCSNKSNTSSLSLHEKRTSSKEERKKIAARRKSPCPSGVH